MGTVSADDFYTGTAAGVAGGTTTIIDFAVQYKGQALNQALVESGYKELRAEQKRRIDSKSNKVLGIGISVQGATLRALRDIGFTVSEGLDLDRDSLIYFYF